MQIADGVPSIRTSPQKRVESPGNDRQQRSGGFDEALAQDGRADTTAVTQQALPSEHEGTASTTSASQVPQQELESQGVLYPWQLVAQAAMSQVGQHAYAALAGGGAPSAAGLATGAVAMTGNAAATRSSVALAAVQGAHWHATPAGGAALARPQEYGAATGALSRPAAEQALASLPAWSERFQRRVEDGQGRATVWLRDYQLGADIPASTIDDIIAFYGPSRPVWRIVVNGSEVWRRPSNNPETI